jgi:uncharacterized protein (DUF1778 family)
MRGRPPKLKSDRRTNQLHILLTEDERQTLDKAARLNAMDLSAWARSELLALAKKAISRKD